MTTVAFLGTGTMGFPMARNLAGAGFALRAWNRSRDRAEPLAEHGATICGDPRDAVSGADVLITMLNDSSAVLDTATRALEGPQDPPVWAQMSTVGLEGTEACCQLAERTGTRLVDAPVLGTRDPAEQGKLVVLASGPDDAMEICRPLFDALGQKTIELGPAGAATRAKLVVNSWVLGVTGLVAETIALAESLDIDPQVFFDAVEGGPLDLPYAQLKGHAMIERSFEDAAFRLSLARKDADLVVAAAEAKSLDSPVLRAVAQRLRRAEEAGHGDEDMAANFLATAPDSADR
ncbi:MAG TPA: NAD(P)-dependent oxidoreductase [Solirubrobacteraceae bacterium]|jgi:3-hydroxyisobutyrate dehydrogenase|nr:NAD(P)-dependent oxidoreductase [Solirubrobacteraceae bacterium]